MYHNLGELSNAEQQLLITVQIQEAIEQAGINGDQSTGIRANTSDLVPNYAAFNDAWKVKWMLL